MSTTFYQSTAEIWDDIVSGDEVEEIRLEDRLVLIKWDEEPLNPRREWENFGTMVCYHRNYDLGDEHDDDLGVIEALRNHPVSAVVRWLKVFHGARVVLPLYLLDHSGLAMSTGRFVGDAAGWDTSFVGLIFDLPQDPEKGWSVEDDQVERVLVGEVETYSSYLEGMVYGYEIYDTEGNLTNSCWGYYDEADAKSDAGVPS